MQNFACDNNDFGRWTYLKMRDATTHGCYFVGAMASKQRAHAEKHWPSQEWAWWKQEGSTSHHKTAPVPVECWKHWLLQIQQSRPKFACDKIRTPNAPITTWLDGGPLKEEIALLPCYVPKRQRSFQSPGKRSCSGLLQKNGARPQTFLWFSGKKKNVVSQRNGRATHSGANAQSTPIAKRLLLLICDKRTSARPSPNPPLVLPFADGWHDVINSNA